MNGVYVASGSVLSLPSRAAFVDRGLGPPEVVMILDVSNVATAPSLIAILMSAKSCAFSESDFPCAALICLAASLNTSNRRDRGVESARRWLDPAAVPCCWRRRPPSPR